MVDANKNKKIKVAAQLGTTASVWNWIATFTKKIWTYAYGKEALALSRQRKLLDEIYSMDHPCETEKT